MSEKASGVRARLAEEMKTMLVVFVYLAAFLGAFTTYRRLVLNEYNIPYLHYGYSLIEALILSKVIVFGSALKIGERFRGRPLIVPTLYKTVSFGVLVVAFSVLEHVVEGWFHGKTTLAAWNAILEQGTWELLARVLVVVVALVPLFAVWETGRAMGEGKLWELFFQRGPEGGEA
ncbi:MAG: hypothetical protein U0835_13365 [Isosphaeraceae bacterium]